MTILSLTSSRVWASALARLRLYLLIFVPRKRLCKCSSCVRAQMWESIYLVQICRLNFELFLDIACYFFVVRRNYCDSPQSTIARLSSTLVAGAGGTEFIIISRGVPSPSPRKLRRSSHFRSNPVRFIVSSLSYSNFIVVTGFNSN